MLDFTVVGIPAGIVVVVLVEAIKRLAKIEGDAAIAVALVVGVLVSAGAHLANISSGFNDWWQVVMAGLLLGLGAAGLYDLGQALKSKT